MAVRRLAGIDRSRPELTMSSAMAVAAASHAAFSALGPAATASKWWENWTVSVQYTELGNQAVRARWRTEVGNQAVRASQRQVSVQ